MSHRRLAPLSVLATVIWVVVLAPVSGQTPAAVAKTTGTSRTWTAPRTPDGLPDLQGIWSFATITPLERPSDLAGKQVLTDEEAATLEERAAQGRVDRPPRAGNTGTYNQFWADRGTKVDQTKRTSLIVDPPDGRVPPMTPAGEKRADARREAMRRPAHGPEDRDLYERCLLGFNAGPPMFPSGYNNNFQLVQARDFVVILNEMVHDARVVPLDRRPHLPKSIRQWRGDSRGHWEGETLVVDTVNFTKEGTGTHPSFLQVTTDENLHLVERFTRVDADTLLYEFTIDDPTIWTRPWSAAVTMTKALGQMYEYACHEGNYGLENILRGARADDKAAEEAAKK
jgi:hypothetical protein